MAQSGETKPIVTTLTEEQRQLAMERFEILRPHIEHDVSLTHSARQAGISVRTAERWLALYRRNGLAGLGRSIRNDAEARRLPDDLLALIEGKEASSFSRRYSSAHQHDGQGARLAGSLLQHRLCDPRRSRPGDGDTGA